MTTPTPSAPRSTTRPGDPTMTAEELARDHRGAPHGGFVIRSGESSPGTTQTIEYHLQEESNPEFTASVLVAYARAAARLAASGEHGARTPFDEIGRASCRERV